jgi:hypothetical protein
MASKAKTATPSKPAAAAAPAKAAAPAAAAKPAAAAAAKPAAAEKKAPAKAAVAQPSKCMRGRELGRAGCAVALRGLCEPSADFAFFSGSPQSLLLVSS